MSGVKDNRGFVTVPYEVWGRMAEVGADAVGVYIALASHVPGRFGEAWPRQDRLAQITGLSLSTVKRCLSRLEDAGLIRVEKRLNEDGGQTSNLYVLPDLGGVGQSDLGGRSERPTNNTKENKTKVVTSSARVSNLAESELVMAQETTPYLLVQSYYDGLEVIGRKVVRSDFKRWLKDGKYALELGMVEGDVVSTLERLGKDKFWANKTITLRRVADEWASRGKVTIRNDVVAESVVDDTFNPWGD